MVRGENRIPYWIDRSLTGLAGPEYDATISFGLPFEPEDSQYGESRLRYLKEEPISVEQAATWRSTRQRLAKPFYPVIRLGHGIKKQLSGVSSLSGTRSTKRASAVRMRYKDKPVGPHTIGSWLASTTRESIEASESGA